jgi:hypothetical protein
MNDTESGEKGAYGVARHDSLLRINLRRSDYREGDKAGHGRGAHREEAAYPQLRKGPPRERYLWLVCREGRGNATGSMERAARSKMTVQGRYWGR